MEELLQTEREYVRALGYVVENYIPELERPDVPQDLRGQRGSIFGNLEKLRDFHQHHFLQELELCLKEPFCVGRCFLKHVSILSGTSAQSQFPVKIKKSFTARYQKTFQSSSKNFSFYRNPLMNPETNTLIIKEQ